MEQTIKIEVPEGKKAVYDETSRTITFVDIEPIRSKSWAEFYKNHPRIETEYYIGNSGSIEIINECNRNCPNNLATKEDAEGILALIQLIRLRDEWVGDWVPTGTSYFYAINYDFINKKPIIHIWIGINFVLSFPNKEMAVKFIDCFRNLILKAKKFI